MSRIFLLLFNPPPGGPDEMLNFLDTRPEIRDWHAVFANGVFLVSNLDSDQMRDIVHEGTGSERFVVTELKFEQRGTGLSGWLPEASWNFLGRHSGENWPQKEKQPA